METITPNSLKSALVSVIDRHNESNEYQVAYFDFFYNGISVFIKGVYQKRDVIKIVQAWGRKISEFYTSQFEVLALYPSLRTGKELYYKETFN